MLSTRIRGRLQKLATLVLEDGSTLSFANEVLADNLARYQQKLRPLLIDSRLRIPDNRTSVADISLGLRNTLDVPIVPITNLTVRPGERMFLVWFTISAYFPLISACLGPLANMISIVALIQHWRFDVDRSIAIPDLPLVVVLNSLSLVFGILGNMSLLVNFSGSIKYMITQTVSICCWMTATVLLVVGIVITNYEFSDPNFTRSEGFWMAVFTAFYYWCCCIILTINLAGCLLKKYPPSFNLNPKQRTLMIYTVTFSIWCMIGTVIMEHMIPELTYGSSLYYCIVSFLTIGLGDIVPKSSGAKVVALILSLGGVLNMGLLVAMIRLVVLSSSGPTILWHQMEKERIKTLASLKDNDISLDSQDAFDQMRMIRNHASYKQLNFSLVMTLIIFCLYWLIGAMVFHFVEHWSYFDGIYFCFLCLLTIGYGDFVPKSPFGKVFFVSWAVSAVPLMTILISNIGDKLYDLADQLSEALNKMFYKRRLHQTEKLETEIREEVEREQAAEENESLEEEDLSDTTARLSTIYEPQPSRVPPYNDFNDFGDFGDFGVPSSTSYDHFTFQKMDDSGVQPSTYGSNSQLDKSISTTSKRNGTRNPFQKSIGPSFLEEYNNVDQEIRKRLSHQKEIYCHMLMFLEKFKPLMLDAIDNPSKMYDYEKWSAMLQYIESEQLRNKIHGDDSMKTVGHQDNLFWLSDDSPLRLPLKEPNYLLMKVFLKMEANLRDLLYMEMEDSKDLRRQYELLRKGREARRG
jgi:potassium channel subfamily K